MTPCLMMSPLSVAQYLPRTPGLFDLLVIDEASQMRPEDALGAIARARQVVVVGDQKQLPPTSFFDRAELDDDDNEEDPSAMESILDRARASLSPARRLQWHYRSRHESLIAFSNRRFYDDDLLLFPSPVLDTRELGVSMLYVEGAKYQKGLNPLEAAEVAAAAVTHMRDRRNETLGVVAANKEQAEYIRAEIDRLAAQDPVIADFIARSEQELEGFFVKNLENVQGPSPTPSTIPLSPSPEPHTNVDLRCWTRMRDRHPVLGGAAAAVPGQRLDTLASCLGHPHRREPRPIGYPVRERLQHPRVAQVLHTGLGQGEGQGGKPGLQRVLRRDAAQARQDVRQVLLAGGLGDQDGCLTLVHARLGPELSLDRLQLGRQLLAHLPLVLATNGHGLWSPAP
jgi:hypothetical protein